MEPVFARATNGDPELRKIVQQEISRFFREHPELDPGNKQHKKN
jgi:hypothetical protein